MNTELYFDYLPEELIKEIFYYIEKFDTFNNLFLIENSTILLILYDETTWKQLLNSKLGYLLNYIVPLKYNRPKVNNLVDFYYRLSYYMRAMNSYKKAIETFGKAKDFLVARRKEHFPNKSEKEIQAYENDPIIVSKVVKHKLEIKFLGGDLITDLSLVLDEGTNLSSQIVLEHYSKILGDRFNVPAIFFNISGFGYHIAFSTGAYVLDHSITEDKFFELLFHIHFNGKN